MNQKRTAIRIATVQHTSGVFLSWFVACEGEEEAMVSLSIEE